MNGTDVCLAKLSLLSPKAYSEESGGLKPLLYCCIASALQWQSKVMHVTSSQVARELWYKLLEQEGGLPSAANQTEPGSATVTEKHVGEFQWDSASSEAQGPEYQRGQVPGWPTTANSKLPFYVSELEVPTDSASPALSRNSSATAKCPQDLDAEKLIIKSLMRYKQPL